MTTLARWDPFRELEDVHTRLSSLFDRAPARRNGGNEAMIVADWSPAVDIAEDDKGYVIKAELPEVKKEEVKVTVENGVLFLSGERRFEKEEKGRRYHRIERAYGSFVRSFTLPEDADPAHVRADFKDGLLRVHVAKGKVAKRRPHPIKVN